MADETPVPVPRGVVEFILDNIDETGVCSFDRGFAIGQRVRLISGPFAEQLGQLVRLDSNGRVRVLIEIMGGSVPALLSSTTVALACWYLVTVIMTG